MVDVQRRNQRHAAGDVRPVNLHALGRRDARPVERGGRVHSQGLVDEGLEEFEFLQVRDGEFAG